MVGLVWFLRRNDEIPLFISGMLFYFSSYRFWAVQQGWAEWVDIVNLGFSPIDNESALVALNQMVLGQTLVLAAYLIAQKRAFPPIKAMLAPSVSTFLKNKVWLFAVVFVGISTVTQIYVFHQQMAGKSDAFEISGYLQLLPLVLTSFAILLMTLIRFGSITFNDRMICLALLAGIAFFSYSTQGRFKFLAWMIAGAVLFTASQSAGKRLFFLIASFFAAAGIFALAGSQRQAVLEVNEVKDDPLQHFKSGEDANMVDGYVLLMEVVPSRVDYLWGAGHLDILLRPIPRAWWPGKPVHNYMLRAAGLDKIAVGSSAEERGFTIGISPSIFGDFYVEAGLVGVVLFSLIYGLAFGKLIYWGAGLHPFGGLLVRGLLCSALTLMLRGGDLPGVYAWLAMSFWPLLLVFVFRRKYLWLNSPWFVNDAVPRKLRRQPPVGPADKLAAS